MKYFGEVSVFIANFNCESFLERAIYSIVNQSYPYWKAYIIDDCSNNFSAFQHIKNSFTDRRLNWFKTDKNVGPFRIYNSLIPIVNTEFFAIQDADDSSDLFRFEKLIELLEKRKASITGSAVRIIMSEQQRIRKLPTNVNNSLLFGYRKGLFFGATMLGRVEFLKQMGGFDGSAFFGGDSEFIYRAVFKGRIINHHESLYNYHIRGNSLTQSANTGFHSPARKLYSKQIKARFISNFISSRLLFSKKLNLYASDNNIDFAIYPIP